MYAVAAQPSAATVTVAPSDSRSRLARRADFVCTGVDDHEQLQAAHDSLVVAGASSGVIQILDGTLNIAAGELELSGRGTTIRGVGVTTIIHVAAGVGTVPGINISGDVVSLSNLAVDGADAGDTPLIDVTGEGAQLQRLLLDAPSVGIAVTSGRGSLLSELSIQGIRLHTAIGAGIGIYLIGAEFPTVNNVTTTCGAATFARGVQVAAGAIHPRVAACTFIGTSLGVVGGLSGLFASLVFADVSKGDAIRCTSNASRNVFDGLLVRGVQDVAGYGFRIDAGCANNHLVAVSLDGGGAGNFLNNGTNTRTIDVNRLTTL